MEQAVRLDEVSKQGISEQLKEMIGLENPNSVMQMRSWLKQQGLEVDSLGKEVVQALLDSELDEKLKQVLLLRQQLAKSSVKKYQTMLAVAGEDGRARGMFMFYGANRTGHWSGRLIQLQNLYRNNISDLAEVRALVKQGNVEAIHLLYDNVPEVLAQLIRTAIVPRKDYKFIVSDFSSIEAIVLAWLSGETWVINAYANKKDLYIKNAERMFRAKEGTVDKHSELRQKSKIATLACGYGGSVGALNAFGATNLGMKEEELKPTVEAWRNANSHIVSFWWDVDRSVKQVVKTRSSVRLRNLAFHYQSGILFITLPSGRKLAYVKPRIGENKFGGKYALSGITYCGKCDEIYRRLHWNNRGKKSIVWRCLGRLDKNKDCDARIVLEVDLKQSVVEGMNKVFADESRIKGILNTSFQKLLKVDNTKELETVDSQLQELQQQLLEQSSRNQNVTDIGEQIIQLKEQKQNILLGKVKNDNSRQRMDEMLKFIDQNGHDDLEYDGVLVRRLVEQVLVYDDYITIKFKSGIDMKVQS